MERRRHVLTELLVSITLISYSVIDPERSSCLAKINMWGNIRTWYLTCAVGSWKIRFIKTYIVVFRLCIHV